MMKSDYEVERASAETRDAMRDRCEEDGHRWQYRWLSPISVSMRCKWCGEEK